MVRVNLINPRNLSDQHLVAEYVEIMMLIGYVKKYPKIDEIPANYKLGPGHIKFFKNKLKYLQQRHEIIKKEMQRRGFKSEKKISLAKFPKNLKNEWKPNFEDKKKIKQRLKEKIRSRPNYHRYYGEKKSTKFFLDLIGKS